MMLLSELFVKPKKNIRTKNYAWERSWTLTYTTHRMAEAIITKRRPTDDLIPLKRSERGPIAMQPIKPPRLMYDCRSATS